MKPEPYAQALYRMLKDGVKPKEGVAKLRKVLTRHGRERLLGKIGKAFARIAAREERRNVLTLTIAHGDDKPKAQSAVKGFLKEIGVALKDVSIQTDENLIGGWRLEGKEHLVDASFKKHLLSIYNRATE